MYSPHPPKAHNLFHAEMGLRHSSWRSGCVLLMATLPALLLASLYPLYFSTQTLSERLVYSALSAFLTFGVVPLFFVYSQVEKGKHRLFLGLTRPPRPSLSNGIKAVLGTLVGLCAVALTSYLSLLFVENWDGIWGEKLRSLHQSAEQLSSFIKQPTTLPLSLFRIGVVAFLTGFVEELYMRGTLQPLLIGILGNKHWGIASTALIFSLLHLSPVHLIPIFIYGLIFGYWRAYSGSLYPGIVLHIFNNLLTLLVA